MKESTLRELVALADLRIKRRIENQNVKSIEVTSSIEKSEDSTNGAKK